MAAEESGRALRYSRFPPFPFCDQDCGRICGENGGVVDVIARGRSTRIRPISAPCHRIAAAASLTQLGNNSTTPLCRSVRISITPTSSCLLNASAQLSLARRHDKRTPKSHPNHLSPSHKACRLGRPHNSPDLRLNNPQTRPHRRPLYFLPSELACLQRVHKTVPHFLLPSPHLPNPHPRKSPTYP